MSYFPVDATCPQCGKSYVFFYGVVNLTVHLDPGFCSLECAQSRLLYLLLAVGGLSTPEGGEVRHERSVPKE